MSDFVVMQYQEFTIVEFTSASLKDQLQLNRLGDDLYKLVDEQDRRKLILDFGKVEYLSSQAVSILLTMRKKLAALPGSQLILVSVTPRLLELLKIMKLDKVFTIKPTQKEAVLKL